MEFDYPHITHTIPRSSDTQLCILFFYVKSLVNEYHLLNNKVYNRYTCTGLQDSLFVHDNLAVASGALNTVPLSQTHDHYLEIRVPTTATEQVTTLKALHGQRWKLKSAYVTDELLTRTSRSSTGSRGLWEMCVCVCGRYMWNKKAIELGSQYDARAYVVSVVSSLVHNMMLELKIFVG